MANGVQIPTVKRIAPVEPTSAGRLNVDVPDASKPMERTSRALQNFGEAAANIAIRAEAEEIDTETTRVNTEYEKKYQTKLYGDIESKTLGVKHKKGNPEENFGQFDKEMEEEYQTIIGDEKYSGRTKEAMIKTLTNTRNRLELQKIAEYGNQKAKYEEGVTTSGVELEKGNLVIQSAYLNPKDSASMAGFDATVGRIRDLRLKNGVKNGSVVPDEKGTGMYVNEEGVATRVSVGASTDYALKKDLSDGIYDAMENLVKSGKIEEAQMLREKYQDYLEPVKRKQLSDDFYKAENKQAAFRAVDETRAMGPDAIDKHFAKLKPEVRDEAYQIMDDRQRRQENLRTRQSKQNYDVIANRVNARMRSENPFSSVTELEADPTFRNAISRVTDARQKQALYDMVIQPKQSSPEAVAKMQKLLFGDDPMNDVRGMDPETFNTYLSQMSKPDRNKYTKIYEGLNSETGAEQNQKYRAAGKELETQLIGVGYVRRNDFGRIEGADELKYIHARNDLIDHLDSTGPMTPKEMKDYVEKYAVSLKKKEAFKPPEKPKFEGTKNPPPKESTGTSPKKPGGKTLVEWSREYLREFGKLPDLKTDALQKYIKSKE